MLKKSLLIQLLETFSSNKLNRLAKFIESPYFVSNSKIHCLLQSLIKLKGDYTKLNSEIIFKKIYAHQPYNNQTLSRLASNALKIVKTFIVCENLFKSKQDIKQNEILEELETLRHLEEKRASLLYNKTLNKLIDKISKVPYKDTQYLYLLHLTAQKGRIASALSQQTRRSTDSNKEIIHLDQTLDAFYLASKLSIASSIANQKRSISFSLDYHPFLPSSIIEKISDLNIEIDTFLINAYFSAYKMLNNTKHSHQYFIALKEILTKQGFQLADRDILALFTYAKNYCVGQIHQSKTQYIEHFIDLFKQEVKECVQIRNLPFNSNNYRNIISLLTDTGKFEEAIQILKVYKDMIEPLSKQKNIYHYCWAIIYFSQKKFQKVENELLQCNFKDIFDIISTKKLLLKNYYERKVNDDFLEKRIESYQRFVRGRKDIQETHRQRFLQFANLFNRLFVLKIDLLTMYQFDFTKIKKLENHIQDKIQSKTDKKWLLDKLNELKNTN